MVVWYLAWKLPSTPPHPPTPHPPTDKRNSIIFSICFSVQGNGQRTQRDAEAGSGTAEFKQDSRRHFADKLERFVHNSYIYKFQTDWIRVFTWWTCFFWGITSFTALSHWFINRCLKVTLCALIWKIATIENNKGVYCYTYGILRISRFNEKPNKTKKQNKTYKGVVIMPADIRTLYVFNHPSTVNFPAIVRHLWLCQYII